MILIGGLGVVAEYSGCFAGKLWCFIELVGFYILMLVFFVVWVGFCLLGLVLFLTSGGRRLEVGGLGSAGNVFGQLKLKR